MKYKTLDEVRKDYDINSFEMHRGIYTDFTINFENSKVLVNHWKNVHGCGDPAFSWSWKLLIQEMPRNFKFLEIGVYQGRILSLVQLLADMLNKHPKIFGITPLKGFMEEDSVDEENMDFLECIKSNYKKVGLTFKNTTILQGLSQDKTVREMAEKEGKFDLLYIDGSHVYSDVKLDITFYLPMLNIGGFLIMDDASARIPAIYGWPGWDDVARAIEETLDTCQKVNHIYAVGHNRVWEKIQE